MPSVPIHGVLIGHYTDGDARTGCTVVRLPEGTIASGEVRGGAPATREFALLDPSRRVDRLDAVALCGGSAFGLAAADGVMAELSEAGTGFATPHGAVPIVVGMAVYDLGVGDGSVRPSAADGREAARAASADFGTGSVGAGAGATVGNWAGADRATAGGIGWAAIEHGEVVIAALMVVNAFGGELEPGDPLTRAASAVNRWTEPATPGENTTIGVVITNAALTKTDCHLVAQSGHDGLARALLPAHTRHDGDALVAAATGAVPTDLDHLRVLAAGVVEAAVRHGAEPSAGT